MTVSTIRSSAEIDTVFRTGKRVSHPLVIALVAPTPSGRDPEGRVAFIAGKRLGGAVTRNRSKRVLRAAAAAAGAPWSGYDVLLIAREGTARANSQEVAEGVRYATKRSGVAE